jgi:alkylated DNA nucleotide flippase Atl1/predicted nuclease with RNAse H fold
MYVGIDVSATRGFDVAIVDDDRHVVLLAKARDLEAAGVIARGLPSGSVIAVDAPPAPSQGLVGGGKRYRVAEEDLHRIGVSLYPVPPADGDAPSWMREGFALFEVLAKAGFPTFFEGTARGGVSFECYPHLTYRTLSGTVRGTLSKIEWSRGALRRRVAGVPKDATQDQLDAIAAAMTAWFFAHDRFVAYGDPREGVIVGPASDDRDEAPLAPDQLAFAIEATNAAAPPPERRETPFVERVLRLVTSIPPGRVATFGDVARTCGKASGARAVGTILAAHPFEVPTHRVVDAAGRPSSAYGGGPERQLERLAAEGARIEAGRVDLTASRWRPE